jgi:hypothetical protein
MNLLNEERERTNKDREEEKVLCLFNMAGIHFFHMLSFIQAKAKMTKIALEFINVTVAHAELNPKTVSLITNLYALTEKSQIDPNYWKNTLNYLKNRKTTASNPNLYDQLLMKLSK